MAYRRFHKSLGIPGLRLNLAKTGPSVSVGGVGLRYNASATGTRTTLGLPGSGLSLIDRHGYGSRSTAPTTPTPPPRAADDDPSLLFAPLAPWLLIVLAGLATVHPVIAACIVGAAAAVIPRWLTVAAVAVIGAIIFLN